MYKVVIETWVEPEWECGDGCCWEPPEQRWAVVEANIPWYKVYPIVIAQWCSVAMDTVIHWWQKRT